MKRLPTKHLLLCSALLLTFSAQAKLPAPVLTEEDKAKAAEAAAKTAWNGRKEAYLLCKSQDRAAVNHQKTAKAKGLELKPVVAVPPCTDPGAFAYVPPKPSDTSGAAMVAATPSSTHAPATATASKKP